MVMLIMVMVMVIIISEKNYDVDVMIKILKVYYIITSITSLSKTFLPILVVAVRLLITDYHKHSHLLTMLLI